MSIKIENVDVLGWKGAIRGARNPMNSWDKSDTWFYIYSEEGCSYYCEMIKEDDYYDHCSDAQDDKEEYLKRLKIGKNNPALCPDLIGPNDHKLLMNLCKGGPEESKWRRMIHVQMDITAPLYWWKEFETYKVGTVSNSCSTMHKIQAKEFTLDDFSHEHLIDGIKDGNCDSFPELRKYAEDPDYYGDYAELCLYPKQILEETIECLNMCRDHFLKTKDKKYWWQMIQLLPSSYNQRRTIDLNYEVLSKQYRERKDHKLDEWRNYCEWIKTLPYSEFITMEENT